MSSSRIVVMTTRPCLGNSVLGSCLSCLNYKSSFYSGFYVRGNGLTYYVFITKALNTRCKKKVQKPPVMYVRLEAKEKFQQLLLSDVTGGKVLQRNNWLL